MFFSNSETIFGVNLLLTGMDKINGKAIKQAPPITPFILRQIHEVLYFKSKFELTMWVLFLTSFFPHVEKIQCDTCFGKRWGKNT